MFPKINPTTTKSWSILKQHQKEIEGQHMREWFNNNPLRFKELSIEFENLLFDYSKNLIQKETLIHLESLFEECQIKEAIKAQFNGERINETEKRAVLHTALRNFSQREVFYNNKDVKPLVESSLQQMETFSQDIITQNWETHNGEPITDIVNIGIGGSDLGPMMAYEALKPFHQKNIKCHYISNIDAAHISETLKPLKASNTLFIIASKTFTTQETMTNAHTAKQWFLSQVKDENAISKHFVAVSTNTTEVKKFGIDPKNIFVFQDWVGGRFSLWSSIGLSLCCGIGFKNYISLLKGAHAMDEHFRTAPFHKNIPMLMAAVGIWYSNFWDVHTEAILPYSENLKYFPNYLQQVNMESNGKDVDRNGNPISYKTGPIVWGAAGTNGQHAFFQLIHQGTHLIPCDFIGFVHSPYNKPEHHNKLMANFMAQTEALMKGKSNTIVEEELQKQKDLNQIDIDKLMPYKVFKGNKPTSSLLFKDYTPYNLGMLISCYEHKVFAQGVVWNIFSFDQWGVELGKQLAGTILNQLQESNSSEQNHDNSTEGLIRFYKSNKPKY